MSVHASIMSGATFCDRPRCYVARTQVETDDIDEAVTELEIPTGIPLVYSLDRELRPIPSERSVAPLSGHFLVDPEELRRKQEEVANQSKQRYGLQQ